MTDNKFNMSFRCFFERDGQVCFNTHYVPDFPLADVPKWIGCYRFTHPNVVSINVKVCFTDVRCEMEGENDGNTND